MKPWRGGGALLAALRLAGVIVALLLFASWWRHQMEPDFRVEQRLRLKPDGGSVRVTRLNLGGETRRALRLASGETMRFVFMVPGEDAVLRFSDGHLDAHPELALRRVLKDGTREAISAHETDIGRWTERRIALDLRAGEDVTLELATLDGRSQPGLGVVFIADVVLESEGRGVDENTIPIVTRSPVADLLTGYGERRRPAPATRQSARIGLDGPSTIPLPQGETFFATAGHLPPDSRLDIVLHVGKLYPDGPSTSGRVVLLAGEVPIAAFEIDVGEQGQDVETVSQVDLSRWEGSSVDLGLRREGADNLYVGLRELAVSAPRASRRRPFAGSGARNVLLVIVDSLRSDRLGCAGYERAVTPHMDALAARGGLYPRVLAPSSWTLPNVATLLTGSSPLSHGLGLANGRVLSPRTTSVAQSASWAGITTALYSSSPWVGKSTGLDIGFETFVHSNLPAPILAEQAIDWLEQASQFEWFLTLHVTDPSYPHEPPMQAVKRVAGTPDPELLSMLRRIDSRPGAAEAVALEVGTMYDAELTVVDDAIGALTTWLDERDLLERTLVIVVGAEGEEFYEHNGRMHGQTLQEEVVCVPVIMAGPGVRGLDGGAFVMTEPVPLVDITALMASLGRLSTKAEQQGRLPPPFGPVVPDPLAYSVLRPFEGVTVSDVDGVRSKRWLWLYDWETGVEKLFDLAADPGALVNRLADRDDVEARFEADSLGDAFVAWARGSLQASAAQAVPLQASEP